MPPGKATPAVEDAMRAGRRAYEAGQFAEATRHFTKAVTEQGDYAPGWLHLGNSRWRRGDRDGAAQAYRRAVEEDPGKGRAWQNLSTVLLAAGAWEEAAAAAQRAAALDPTSCKGWNNLAAARHALGDHRGAETALRRALEADEAFGTSWANLGRLLLEERRGEEAEAALRRAFDLGERDPATRLALVHAMTARGETAGAADLLVEGVKASPSSLDLWLALGDLRRARGEAAAALDAYEGAASAAADMGDPARDRVARRRVLTALSVLRDVVATGDRAAFLESVDRLRTAVAEAPGPGLAADAEVAIARVRVAEATDGRLDPHWIAEVLDGALRRAEPTRPAPSPPRP